MVPPKLIGKRVLVVDDNATHRQILEEMLAQWQMQASSAASTGEAWDLLQRASEPYAIILADAEMPGSSGFVLAEQLKQNPPVGSSLIMMLNSGDRPGETARCEQMGVTSYVLKPLKPAELRDAMALALGASPERPEVAESSPETRLPQLPPLRILLAEDSPVNQKLAIWLLEKEGHTVVVANDGREAVDAVESRQFDLVLMDVQMPEMDGFEATALIREREKRHGRRLPIIAMTAHAMKGDRERCLEAGMDDYVPKPVRAPVLFQTIHTLLASSGAKRDA